MVGHGESSAGSYLADPTSPIPSHCASVVMTSTLRVNILLSQSMSVSVWNTSAAPMERVCLTMYSVTLLMTAEMVVMKWTVVSLCSN